MFSLFGHMSVIANEKLQHRSREAEGARLVSGSGFVLQEGSMMIDN